MLHFFSAVQCGQMVIFQQRSQIFPSGYPGRIYGKAFCMLHKFSYASFRANFVADISSLNILSLNILFLNILFLNIMFLNILFLDILLLNIMFLDILLLDILLLNILLLNISFVNDRLPVFG